LLCLTEICILYELENTLGWLILSKIEYVVPQGLIVGPLLFLIFMNDLPHFLNDKSVPILFVDDTSILLFHSNCTDLSNNINTIFKILNHWFKQNWLSLNFTKTQFTNFTTRNNNQVEININYDNKFIPTVAYTTFFCLTLSFLLTCLNHIDSLTKELSTMCYLLQNFKPYLSISTLKIIYHSLFHSIMSYDILFWEDSSHNSVIFKMQKRVMRIIMGYDYRESCRVLFKELKLLTLSSQYIFSLLLFIFVI
jgi:hypothetical protein